MSHLPASTLRIARLSSGAILSNAFKSTLQAGTSEQMLIWETRQPAGPGMRRVLGRMAQCVLTYLILYALAWVIMTLAGRHEDSYAVVVRDCLMVLVITGVPTLFLALLAGLAHTEMDVARFRMALAAPMLLFAWPMLAASTAEPLLFQATAQLAFAWLTPAPLVPENWVGRP
ncbi:hypothetical protein [Streptomyces sp. AM8-1-1]|uniref:hypothetical protein n=1 Tax=Streptomyces sp. AM8-1-1 TaxID=3075825 RepID=UPI0028C4B86B|nr:hypothetical protein [Streptomyces sp. AM8-1-1]WNO74782.1 hypothetical protein RPQ07_25645 [Streptomyces sp. AM8-1-1]